MNCSISLYYLPFDCARAGFSVVKGSIRLLSDLSYKLDEVKFGQKISAVSIKILEFVPLAVELLPLKTAKTVCRRIKLIINVCMFGRSANSFAEGKVNSVRMLVLNVAGVVLGIFASIEVLELCKYDMSAIHQAAASVPVFGVLPYAGLLNLALLTLFACTLLGNVEKRTGMQQEWSQADAKFEKWNIRLQGESSTKNVYKTQHWKKISLENSCNRYSIGSGVISVVGLVATTVLTLSGVGLAVIGAVGLILAAPDIYCGCKTFFLKREISHIQPAAHYFL